MYDPQTLSLVWHNGDFVPAESAPLPTGQFAYEALRATRSKLYFAQYHAQRLTRGLAHLGWHAPPPEYLAEKTFELLSLLDEDLTCFRIRWILWMDCGHGLHARVDAAPLALAPDVWWSDTPLHLVSVAGYTLGTQTDFWFKQGEARAWYRRALAQAQAEGADDVLLTDADGFPRETALRTLVAWDGQGWSTPPRSLAQLESVLQRAMLDTGLVQQGRLMPDAGAWLAGNSVRGLQSAVLRKVECTLPLEPVAQLLTELQAAALRKDRNLHIYPA
jgi:branched-subunit amino acid aminotransferase/4-amino-4-deoxychorismate lyase